MSDLKTFRSNLRKAYQRKVLIPLEKRVRAVALVVDTQLALRTPVDTGRARANWIANLDAPSVDIVEPGQKPDLQNQIANFTIDKTIFISNNLPYIRRLNEGHSQQAPAGFVEDAIQIGKNTVR